MSSAPPSSCTPGRPMAELNNIQQDAADRVMRIREWLKLEASRRAKADRVRWENAVSEALELAPPITFKEAHEGVCAERDEMEGCPCTPESSCGGTGWIELEGEERPCRKCNPGGEWRSAGLHAGGER